MESQKLVGYGLTAASIPYPTSHPTVPSIPNRLFGSLKFEIGNSPDSPFMTQFETETLSTVSENQEQHSSTVNSPSGFSLCSGNILETSSNLWRPSSLPVDYYRRILVPRDATGRQNMKCALQELENVLMSNDDNEVTASGTSLKRHNPQTIAQVLVQRSRSMSSGSHGPRLIPLNQSMLDEVVSLEKRHRVEVESSIKEAKPQTLKQLLFSCARALYEEDSMDEFDKLIKKARSTVSVCGEPIQRVGAYMIEGLVARKESSGTSIYRTLKCKEPEGKDLLSYMHILYEICPYLKFGYMAANGAIAEACRNEDYIHIIDFQIAQGTQWITLLQALAARPGGPPHVRITAIDDPVSKYARGFGLEVVRSCLASIAQQSKIPLEFSGLPVFAPEVTRDMLDIRPGEALAVNFPLQLHHTPDESVDVNNPRDELLRMVKSLSPKVTTLVEQESNTNTTPFLTRFAETLDYYLAMFESIDVALPRDRKERIEVEQHCLARDMVNIIACEGRERVERHELFGKWKSRLTMAGFRQYPLSSYVNSVIRSLLKRYSEHYTLDDKDGAMLLGWKDRKLISASAWH